MANKTNIDFDVCGYWQSQLNEMSMFYDELDDDTVVGVALFKGPVYADKYDIYSIEEAQAILRQLTSKGKVVEFTCNGKDDDYEDGCYLKCKWSDLLTASGIDAVFQQHPELVMGFETNVECELDVLDFGHFYLPRCIAERRIYDKLRDYHTKLLSNHTKQLLATTQKLARHTYAGRRIHRFWRDVCWNPNYAYARNRLSQLHANDE